MNLAYDNTFKATSESPEKSLSDEKCSDLVIEIHKNVDGGSVFKCKLYCIFASSQKLDYLLNSVKE
jgi:hypothetical protein